MFDQLYANLLCEGLYPSVLKGITIPQQIIKPHREMIKAQRILSSKIMYNNVTTPKCLSILSTRIVSEDTKSRRQKVKRMRKNSIAIQNHPHFQDLIIRTRYRFWSCGIIRMRYYGVGGYLSSMLASRHK